VFFEESSQSVYANSIMLNINTVIAGDDSEDQFRKLIDKTDIKSEIKLKKIDNTTHYKTFPCKSCD